jgi:hypothetical protein
LLLGSPFRLKVMQRLLMALLLLAEIWKEVACADSRPLEVEVRAPEGPVMVNDG